MLRRAHVALLIGLALGIAPFAGAEPAPSTTTTRSTAMHEFAFVFRAGPTVAGGDLTKRNAAARDWALARRADGTLRAASPLEDDGAIVAASGVTPVSHDHPIASVLVIAVRDLETAIALAQHHPGLAFGTTIEVRPVKPVAGAPQP